ncbi:MAG: ferritin family protein [Phycisphaerae bacterium]|nr:ferritin family protein [Phycisphaerae bacterium]
MTEITPDYEILEFAIAKEIEASNFYLAMADRVTSPGIRKVFEDLAKEELEHKAKLELEVMKTGRVVSTPGKLTIPEHDYILSDSQSLLNMDYKDLLLLGIEKEQAAFRLYVSMVSQVKDTQSRELLLGLAEEEVKHKLRFETEYDLLLSKKLI